MKNPLLCPNRKIALELFEALQALYDSIPPGLRNRFLNEEQKVSKELLLRASQYFAKQEKESAAVDRSRDLMPSSVHPEVRRYDERELDHLSHLSTGDICEAFKRSGECLDMKLKSATFSSFYVNEQREIVAIYHCDEGSLFVKNDGFGLKGEF